MSWVDCVADNDYEIFTEFPFQIRKKSTNTIIKECVDKSNGFIVCTLNLKKFRKHRVIAQQFIPNPNNLPAVIHINRDKTDNHIENLSWANNQNNTKLKSNESTSKLIISHSIVFDLA